MTRNFNHCRAVVSTMTYCIVKVWPASDPRPRVPRQQLRGPAAALADTRPTLALAEAARRALLRREAGQCRHTSDEDCSRVTCVKVECYDLEEEQWLVLTEKPGHVFGSAMCYLKGLMPAKTTDWVHLSYSTSKCDLQVLNVTTFICRQALHHRRGAVQAGWPVRRGGGQVARCLLQCYLSYPCVTYHRWKDYFPSLRHCRVAHGAVASGDTIYVTGGSAKANANFGPGWYYLVLIPAC